MNRLSRIACPFDDSLLPAPTALYGCEKLLSAYTGPLFTVRRSSDGLLFDVYPVGGGGPDVSGMLSFIGANSATVSTWYDQTGNGRHVTQATPANQPRVVNAGALELSGGKLALRFLSNSLLESAATAQLFSAAGWSIYLAAEPTSITAADGNFFDPGGIIGIANGWNGIALQVSGAVGGVFTTVGTNTPRTARLLGPHGYLLNYSANVDVGLQVDADARLSTSCTTMGAFTGNFRVGFANQGAFTGLMHTIAVFNSRIEANQIRLFRDLSMRIGVPQ